MRHPLADPAIVSERAPHRASSLPQSPINLPVKQIPGLSGAPVCITQMRGYVRSVKSSATILSRAQHDAARNTSEPHFIVKNSLRIVEERERDLRSPRLCAPYESAAELSDQLELEEPACFGATTFLAIFWDVKWADCTPLPKGRLNVRFVYYWPNCFFFFFWGQSIIFAMLSRSLQNFASTS